jgi:hypothetical protein
MPEPQDASPATRASPGPDRWRALLAPGLLLALGVFQIVLALGVGLSPWKGGGFGMFSTTDHGGLRHVVVTDAAGGRVRVPSELHRLRGRAREYPHASWLARLGEALQEALPERGPVRVEVRRLEFAPVDLRPTSRLIAAWDGAASDAPGPEREGHEGR